MPTLLGQPQTAHDYLYWSYGEKRAVRDGDWKAVVPGKDKPLELYNLSQDIGESTDVAGENPGVVSKLAAMMDHARQPLP